MSNNTPTIKLLTFTANPLETMAYAWDVMQNDVPDNLDPYKVKTREMLLETFQKIVKDGVGTPTEYVNTVWVFKNVSRAFQQQLTRYRVGTSFSIQSLRRVDVGNFAEKELYHCPEKLKNKPSELAFHRGMLGIQYAYNEMIEKGVTIEDARGILPLNIYSTVTASISLRSLFNIARHRTCTHAQDEWKEVMKQMKAEVAEKIHPEVAKEIFAAPCERTGQCAFPDRCCGKVNGGKTVQCEICGQPVPEEEIWTMLNVPTGIKRKLCRTCHDKEWFA